MEGAIGQMHRLIQVNARRIEQGAEIVRPG
jgi:hypothetical protein